MTVSRLERIAVACVGILLFAIASVWSSQYAVSAPNVNVPTVAVNPHDRTATVKDIQQITRLDRIHGMILDPWAAQPQQGLLNSFGRSSLHFGTTLPSGVPANPMGFDTTHVPGMLDPGSSGMPLQSVYALGTDYAILVQGGPLIHKGSIVNGILVDHVDASGVYLADGEILRLGSDTATGAGTTVTAPQGSQQTTVHGNTYTGRLAHGATISPQPSPTSSPAQAKSPDAQSALNALLWARARSGGASPQPANPRGVR